MKKNNKYFQLMFILSLFCIYHCEGILEQAGGQKVDEENFSSFKEDGKDIKDIFVINQTNNRPKILASRMDKPEILVGQESKLELLIFNPNDDELIFSYEMAVQDDNNNNNVDTENEFPYGKIEGTDNLNEAVYTAPTTLLEDKKSYNFKIAITLKPSDQKFTHQIKVYNADTKAQADLAVNPVISEITASKSSLSAVNTELEKLFASKSKDTSTKKETDKGEYEKKEYGKESYNKEESTKKNSESSDSYKKEVSKEDTKQTEYQNFELGTIFKIELELEIENTKEDTNYKTQWFSSKGGFALWLSTTTNSYFGCEKDSPEKVKIIAVVTNPDSGTTWMETEVDCNQ